jgi:membrane-associated protease RseP (regulator of RpoE activity)
VRKASVIAFIVAMAVLSGGVFSEAAPKAITLRTSDRGGVLEYIAQSMMTQGFKMTSSDPYSLVFEKKSHSFSGIALYREPWVFKNPVFRKTWSVIPSPGGLEAVIDTFFVANPGTKHEKAYATDEVVSLSEESRIDKEKLYDLFDLKAAVEGLDRYFLMRVSGQFPELEPDFPKADMLMEGNRIIAVIPDGLAGRAGIRAGDVILEMNGLQVTGDVVEPIDLRLAQGSRVVLLVQRNSARELVTLTDPDIQPYQKQKREPQYRVPSKKEARSK